MEDTSDHRGEPDGTRDLPGGRNDADAADNEERPRFSRAAKAITLLVAGMLCIVLVGAFGWYQFARRASKPIETVRLHAIPGTDLTIAEGIYDFINDSGIDISDEAFKPSWGAEEVDDDTWVVSYVYEVGREAHWVSWKVKCGTGEVVPRDELARRLWGE